MILVGIKQISCIDGVLKSSPDDFVVDELMLYEPCGEGEHLYLSVRKTNMSHDELVRQIAREFGVSKRDVGVAGRKDLRAVTTQMISVYLPRKEISTPETIGSIEVLASNWHTNKLRLGHLSGNRFSIRLREIDHRNPRNPRNPQTYELIKERFFSLSQTGLPNLFGPQRFGNHGNNHKLGLAVILEDWDAVVKELLCGEERHHSFAKEGEYKKAVDAWPFGQPAQRNVLEALAHGKSPEQACKTIAKSLRKLWVNAFQSAVFNEVLGCRLKDGTWNTILEGDVVWNHEGGGRTFVATPEDVRSVAIEERISTFSISPTGPLWGAKMRLPTENVLKLEQSVLSSFDVDAEHLAKIKKIAKGARRPLRVQVANQVMEVGADHVGDFVELKFELPAGSYATVVIDKLLRGDV